MARGGKKKLNVVGGAGDLEHDNTKNSLSDDDLHVLTLQHKRKYEVALAAKKKADADFKNVCKLAKAELGDTAVLDIKDMIAAEEDGFEEKLRAELDRKARLARWLGLSIGTQGDFFAVADDRPLTERAFNEGLRAGIDSEGPLNPPYAPGTEAYESYCEGWHKGQEKLLESIKKTAEPTPPLLRPEGNEPAEADEFDAASEGGAFATEPAEEVEATPWPDDAAVAAREPAEAL